MKQENGLLDVLLGMVKKTMPRSDLYPATLQSAEEEEIKKRRERSGVPEAEPLIGIGLSGGGIRSATFSLGLFQALARLKLVKRLDFMSTVSGGGYFGSFLGRLFSRNTSSTLREPEDALQAGSFEMRWLRWGGRYLAPNGSGDMVMGGAVWLRNWIAVVLALALALLSIFILVTSATVKFYDLFPRITNTIIWWSPWFYAEVVLLLVCFMPAAWAYWLAPKRENQRINGYALCATIIALLLGVAGLDTILTGPVAGVPPLINQWHETIAPMSYAFSALGIMAAISVVFYVICRCCRKGAQVRNLLSRLLTWSLTGILLVLAIAIVDSLGQTVYAVSREGELADWITTLAAAFGALTAGARKLVRSVPIKKDGGGLTAKVLIIAISITTLLVFLTSISAVSHAIAWGWRATGWQIGSDSWHLNAHADWYQIVISFLICSVLGLCIGRNIVLLNRSTSQPLYSARLIRSYLGASNPERQKNENMSILEPIDGDDVEWGKYRPQDAGGPLHIVNVTLNETVHARSGIENRTRKGEPMAIGPCGISVGREHHARFEKPYDPQTLVHDDGSLSPCGNPEGKAFHLFVTDLIKQDPKGHIRPEPLTLGQWVGISGAAVSTGMGNRTSLFTSILLGLFNVRLGYWWDSSIRPGSRPHKAPERLSRKLGRAFSRLQPVYAGLIDEILARFHGANRRRWYLSDGGHFENMGGYELIRRRLPLIIIVDAECDPEYQFQGLGTLVRQARIDLGAEIRFLSKEDLATISPDLPAEIWLGSLNDLTRQPSFSKGYAAIARVYYDDKETAGSILLYIKPTLTGDEPEDVLHYHAENPKFPQQTTADQFFDEAQWESYRKLGELIGSRLLGEDLA